MNEWRIYLEEAPPTLGWPRAIPAGWFGPGAHGVTSINRPLYMRTPNKNDAIVFTCEHEVIRTVMDWNRSGWQCRAEPPITITL